MIDALFQQLGFSSNEQKVYLALAEMGKSTAALIAKQSELPRSTAYSVLEQLVLRGLVSLERDGSQTMYLANSPASLVAMVEKERTALLEELDCRQQAARELIERVGPFFKRQHFSVPRIQFFEGRSNVENMLFEQCLTWQKSAAERDSIWWGYQDHTFVHEYRKWLEYYWYEAGSEQEQALLFSNRSDIEAELAGTVPRRHVKLVPEGFGISSTIWVAGDYVVTIMARQKPHYAFQLHDAVFASNQRNIFRLLWESRD